MDDTMPRQAGVSAAPEAVGKRKRWKTGVFWGLIAAIIAAAILLALYLTKPQALPDLIPLPVTVYAQPHYRYSISKVSGPVGVALSPDGKRLYVAESDGKRLVKAFDTTGRRLFSIAIPATDPGTRAPVYMAVAPNGNLFVSDRVQAAIYVFSPEGKYIEEIIAPSMTMTGYLVSKLGELPEGLTYSYNAVSRHVVINIPGKEPQTLPAPEPAWNPLGLRFDGNGNLFVTDVAGAAQSVHVISAEALAATSSLDFNPTDVQFGTPGSEAGQLMFPNVAAADSRGRVYVSDGNNGRLTAWDAQGKYVTAFGSAGGQSIGLPRGMWIDGKDRLFSVDAINHDVKVFDVSGDAPKGLGRFGVYGVERGEFNYPNDIVGDQAGNLFIADRVNNKVQVWSN